METPLKISFQGGDTSEALSGLIAAQAAGLEKLHGRLTACHVVVRVPERPNGLYVVHVHVTLPGGGTVNIDHTPAEDPRLHDPQLAVQDAFRRAKRQLKNYASRRRGDVKTLHERIERTLDRPEG